jgi:hypothetical protein
MEKYRANFLWPVGSNASIEAAAYEFANAKTEKYCKMWYREMKRRIEQKIIKKYKLVKSRKN